MNFLTAAHEFLCQAIITSLTACAFALIVFAVIFSIAILVDYIKIAGGIKNFLMLKIPDDEELEDE